MLICAVLNVKASDGRLMVRLRPRRGLKQLRCIRVISAGHGLVQMSTARPRRTGLDALYCAVPKLDAWLLTRSFQAGLGCSPVLVDHAAEDSMVPDRGVERDDGDRIMAGLVLVEALVWPMVVEVVQPFGGFAGRTCQRQAAQGVLPLDAPTRGWDRLESRWRPLMPRAGVLRSGPGHSTCRIRV